MIQIVQVSQTAALNVTKEESMTGYSETKPNLNKLTMEWV